jgi:hypothetical protein
MSLLTSAATGFGVLENYQRPKKRGSRRGDEAHFSDGRVKNEPPHVGCYEGLGFWVLENYQRPKETVADEVTRLTSQTGG